MQMINPLGCTVSITSMLYCQGRTDHSSTQALPGVSRGPHEIP
ncbi:unnamed protein product, partial [Staurois parvus]